jgi:ATP-dependent protease ClpP protease subunit
LDFWHHFLQTRPANLQGPRKWYNIGPINAAGEAEIFLYDVIGESWFGGITANQFVQDLRNVSASKISLRINSPGGDIADGIAIRNALRDHPADVETHIDGLAASTASWVGLVGNVIMSPNSMLMIHEPFNIMAGDAADFRKQADVLDKFGEEIASMYAAKGDARKNWRDLMKAETWYTDKEAVAAGLADSIGGEAKVSNQYDLGILNIFKNTPQHLIKPEQPAPAPEPAARASLLPEFLAFQKNLVRQNGVQV